MEREKFLRNGAFEWVVRATPFIEAILAKELELESELRRQLVEKYGTWKGRRLFDISEDIYSNPFCDKLESLPFVVSKDVTVVTAKVIVSNSRFGYKKVPFHYFFKIEKLVIDPTFGQFVDLDLAIEEYPGNFVGRIMVGTIEEAAKNMGVCYLV